MGMAGHMGMTTPIRMSEALITLTQWLSPAFPVGAFAYSHGLEQAIADGEIATAGDLQHWLEDICAYGAGQSDVILMAHAFGGKVAEADMYARAMAASAERLQEMDLQGAAFVQTVNAVWSLDLPPLAYPVAIGAAAAKQGLPLEETARVYLHAMLGNLTSAAIRLVPLGQTEGQRALAGLTPLIAETVKVALSMGLDDLGASCFAGDIAAMRHETLETRIFRT